MALEDTTDTTTSETTATTETKPAETAAVATTEAAREAAPEGSLMGDAGEAKPAEGAEGEAKAAEEGEKKVEAIVPETYELAMPEGFTLDKDLLDEATPIFKGLKLTNEQANQLVPMAAKLAGNVSKQQQDAFAAVASDWAREAQKDPDIGGQNWAETESYVAKALDAFAGPAKDKDGKVNEFRQLLNDSKLGNHPAMIRAWRNVGKAISEDDKFVRPDAGAQVKPSREEVLYPSMTQKE